MTNEEKILSLLGEITTRLGSVESETRKTREEVHKTQEEVRKTQEEVRKTQEEVRKTQGEVRQLRVIVEEQEKKIQIIAEACSSLPAQREKLEEIDAKVDVLNDRLFAVEESSRRHRTILQELKKAE